MTNVGSSYSQIIPSKDYIRLMSDEHLYISDADQFIVQKIREFTPLGGEVVELGCGPGRVLSLVSEIEGINITGVEPDPQFADYARGYIRKPNAQIITASAEQYQHPRKANIFYSQGMHHHVAKGDQTQKYLQNVFNALTEDGWYILSDEFLAHYNDSQDREKKVVIWHSHIIADAIKKGFSYLAQEEAKTLLDDLFEGRTNKEIKSKEQIQFALSKVQTIDEAVLTGQKKRADELAQEFLIELENYHNLAHHGDMTIDLSRGDYKICEEELKKELEKANFKIKEIKSIGPIKTSGAMSIYVLSKN